MSFNTPIIIISDTQITTIETKTDNYSITTLDFNKLLILGVATSAAKVFTLPSVGASENGKWIDILTKTSYKLLLDPSDTDNVATGQNTQGVETDILGSYCRLTYRHATTTWELKVFAGKWGLEELLFYISPEESTMDLTRQMGLYPFRAYDSNYWPKIKTDATKGLFFDFDNAHGINNNWFPDIMSNSYTDFTIMLNLKLTGSVSTYLFKFEEDSNNYFNLLSHSDDKLYVQYKRGGVEDINISSSVLTQGQWYSVVLVRTGTDVGLYLDGIQVVHSIGAMTAASISLVKLGFCTNDGYVPLNGYVDKIICIGKNIFGAVPNVGDTDTITVPSTWPQMVWSA